MKVKISNIKINPGRRETEPKAIEELARSIAAVGLMNPITLDQNNTLIAGLHRLETAKLMGWTEIECSITILFHWTTPGNSGTSGDRLGLCGGFLTGYVWKMIYRLSSIRNFTARAVSCTMASGSGSGPRLPSRGYGLPSLRL